MGTAKRERQKARRQERLAAEKAAQQTAQRTRSVKRIGILAAVAVGLVLLVWLFTRDGGGDDTSSTDEDTSTLVDAGATDDTGECPPEGGAADRVTAFSGAWLEGLPTCIEEGTDYTATLALSTGKSVTIELDAAAAPEAVNSFVILARYGYFDGTPVFRTNNKQHYIRFGHPETGEIAAPGFAVAAGENADAELSSGSVVLALTGDGAVGASVDILGSETRDYLASGTVIGDLDSESGPAIEDVLALHEPGEQFIDQDEGNGAPSEPVTIDSVTITAG